MTDNGIHLAWTDSSRPRGPAGCVIMVPSTGAMVNVYAVCGLGCSSIFQTPEVAAERTR